MGQLNNLEHVWLIHRGGFCAALKLQSSGNLDKVNIKLLHNGEEITVDQDDIESANSSALDFVEDLCQLRQLNESSILHCLRQRFFNNLIHTQAGNITIFINPMAPLSLYSEKVRFNKMFYIELNIYVRFCVFNFRLYQCFADARQTICLHIYILQPNPLTDLCWILEEIKALYF